MTRCSRRAFTAATLSTLAAVAVPGLASGPATEPARGNRRGSADGDALLRFGVTPVVLDDHVGFLNRWSDWMAAALGRPVTLVQRTRYREIVDLLLRGQLHLAWLCGYPYVQYQDRLGLIAVPRWHGDPLYRSEIIVPAGSQIRSLAELEGKLFAWTDPDSNSGWLYPRYLLERSGRDPERFFRRTIFTWGHARSVQAVADGLVDAAAVDAYVRETLMLHTPGLADAVRVIERSPLFGFPPIVAGPALDEAGRDAIRTLLLGQASDPEGRALLANLNLDGFSGEGAALYLDIASMAEWLERRRQP
jgi:phosphonate transport system substrate-binding protein